MPVILIAYDIREEASRTKVLDIIKKEFSSYVKLSESAYAVHTDLSVDEIYEYFESLIDSNDNFHVITLSLPYKGHSPPDPDHPLYTPNRWVEYYLQQETFHD